MFQATLYYDTGFNSVNVPDKPELLDNIPSNMKKSVPAMDILQLYHNKEITIKAFEQDVQAADYLKLYRNQAAYGDYAYYYIKSYTMTSGDTITLSVIMDPLLTAGGIDHIGITDGMLVRRHVNSDNWGAYLIEDPLLQRQEPDIVEYGGQIFGPSSDMDSPEDKLIMLCTMDPRDAANFKYDIDSGSGKMCEFSNPSAGQTSLYGFLPYDDNKSTAYDGANYKLENSQSYFAAVCNHDSSRQDLLDLLAPILANGLEKIIQRAYYIPWWWVADNEEQSVSSYVYYPTRIYSRAQDIQTNLFKVNKSSVKNLKALYTHRDIIVIPSATGQPKTIDSALLACGPAIGPNPPEGDYVKLHAYGWSDVRPSGGVTFAIEKRGQSPFNELINGGTWAEAPLVLNGVSGYNINKSLFDRQQEVGDLKADLSIEAGTQKSLANPFSIFGDMWRGFKEGNASGGFMGGIDQAASALYGGMFGWDPYDSLYTMDGSGDVGRGVLAGNERAIAKANRMADKQSELAQFNAGNVPSTHVLTTQFAENDIYGHALHVFMRRPSDNDVQRFDKILTRYGYRVNEAFTAYSFTGRKYFNYVQTSGAALSRTTSVNAHSSAPNKVPKTVYEELADMFNVGVRIWHSVPGVIGYGTAYQNNPIQTGGN